VSEAELNVEEQRLEAEQATAAHAAALEATRSKRGEFEKFSKLPTLQSRIHDEVEHRSEWKVPHGEYTDASPRTKRLIDSRALKRMSSIAP
jgi:hypothetical protein